MSTFAWDPGLKQTVELLLYSLGAGNGFQQEVLTRLDSFLEPGEMLLAYAGCPPVEKNQTDAFAYTPGGPKTQTDAFYYSHDDGAPQTDALAYDVERGGRQPDVMGYRAWTNTAQTDAFAYERPLPSPDNDAFMAPAKLQPYIHFLLLTDRRLIDGHMDHEVLVLGQAQTVATTNAWVQTAWAPVD
jgi:hypothetical protein